MKKLPPHVAARETDRWTEIMLRALSNRVAKRWRFVSFRGKNRGEWRGIVDVVAIRKSTAATESGSLKRGDLFDIILIQMKGGSAKMPSLDERHRLREVARHYGAREVILFQWNRGKATTFCTLTRSLEWDRTTCRQIFG